MCIRLQVWNFKNTSNPVGFEPLLRRHAHPRVLVSGDDKSTHTNGGTFSDNMLVNYLK